ncbi:hypothetical protein LTS10_004974 [Elasticomyces elasticus]|nr:hypothetical protein LTS10_004974 [Elasticomyces elasticus]
MLSLSSHAWWSAKRSFRRTELQSFVNFSWTAREHPVAAFKQSKRNAIRVIRNPFRDYWRLSGVAQMMTLWNDAFNERAKLEPLTDGEAEELAESLALTSTWIGAIRTSELCGFTAINYTSDKNMDNTAAEGRLRNRPQTSQQINDMTQESQRGSQDASASRGNDSNQTSPGREGDHTAGAASQEAGAKTEEYVRRLPDLGRVDAQAWEMREAGMTKTKTYLDAGDLIPYREDAPFGVELQRRADNDFRPVTLSAAELADRDNPPPIPRTLQPAPWGPTQPAANPMDRLQLTQLAPSRRVEDLRLGDSPRNATPSQNLPSGGVTDSPGVANMPTRGV